MLNKERLVVAVVIATIAEVVLWLVWHIITGSRPITTEVAGWTLPFGVDRIWDVFIPILSASILMLGVKIKRVKKPGFVKAMMMLGVGFIWLPSTIIGLIFGIIHGFLIVVLVAIAITMMTAGFNLAFEAPDKICAKIWPEFM